MQNLLVHLHQKSSGVLSHNAFLILLVFLFSLGVGNVWGTETPYTLTDISTPTSASTDGFTFTFAKNSGNDPAWNAGNSEARVYVNGYFTISHSSATITKIVYTLKQNQGGSSNKAYPTGYSFDATNTSTASFTVGTSTSITWEGSASSVQLTVNGAKGNYGFKSVTITYSSGGGSTYSVTYNKNNAGASGTMTDTNSPYASGATVTVLDNSFTAPTGYTFDHWNTANDDSGESYDPDDTFTISANTTLYAQWKSDAADKEFTLVEDISELEADNKIVIVAYYNSAYYAMSTDRGDNRLGVIASTSQFTMSNSNKTLTTASTTTVEMLTLTSTDAGYFGFQALNGNYLYAAGSSSNYLKTKEYAGGTLDNDSKWKVTLSAGKFTVQADKSTNRHIMQFNYNSNNPTIFSCYSSATQTAVLIYVLDEGTKYDITWNKNGNGTAPTSPTNASKVTLPDISVTGYTNTGWKANQNVTNASTSATITAGTLITNGTRVILGAATTFTAQWETDTYTVTTSGLTNISPTSAFPANVTYTGSTDHSLDRTLQAADGYVLPATITVTMGGSTLTAGTDYTYSSSNGAFAISKVITDNIVISGSAYLRLDGIAVTTNPTKLAYFAGESFSNAGAVVTATMGDNTTKTVTAAWTPPATPLVAGASQTVSISYTENGMTKTTSVTINVYSVTVNKVNENGEAVDVSGVTADWTVATKGLSATASSASKYVFKEWAFSGNNQGLTIASTSATSTTVSGTPTGDVVINAVFWAPRSVVWMVNEEAYTKGNPTSTIAYNSSWSDLSLPTDPTIPCGDKFMGWTTTEIGSNGLDKDDDAADIVALDLMTSDNKSGKTANKITAATTTFHAVLADYVEPAD